MTPERRTRPDSLDALVAAADSHRRLFENDIVRVLEARISPGETTQRHRSWPTRVKEGGALRHRVSRPYALCMELEVRPASEVERFVAFAQANGCQCKRWAAGHRLTFDVPLARDPTEARRIALDLIANFSAENTRADVRVTQYD